MTRSHTLAWTAPPDDVNAVHDFLQQVWTHFPELDEMDRMTFETAIIELASNVIEHAETADDGIACLLNVYWDGDELRAELTDSADAGSFRLVPREMPGLDAESGRGIPLIQAMVDDLRYERIGDRNQWSISKKRR